MLAREMRVFLMHALERFDEHARVTVFLKGDLAAVPVLIGIRRDHGLRDAIGCQPRRGDDRPTVAGIGDLASWLNLRGSRNGALPAEALRDLDGFSAVIWWGDVETGRAYARVLAARRGEIQPLITALPDLAHVAHERHLCVDTTASGGNASLLTLGD